jgi:hypothetical protein
MCPAVFPSHGGGTEPSRSPPCKAFQMRRGSANTCQKVTARVVAIGRPVFSHKVRHRRPDYHEADLVPDVG